MRLTIAPFVNSLARQSAWLWWPDKGIQPASQCGSNTWLRFEVSNKNTQLTLPIIPKIFLMWRMDGFLLMQPSVTRARGWIDGLYWKASFWLSSAHSDNQSQSTTSLTHACQSKVFFQPKMWNNRQQTKNAQSASNVERKCWNWNHG